VPEESLGFGSGPALEQPECHVCWVMSMPKVDFWPGCGKLTGVKGSEHALREGEVRSLDLRYSDPLGRLRHVSLPIERLEHAAKDGVGFDSSAVAGFRIVDSGDVTRKPGLDSGFVDPFACEPTVSGFAEICESEPRAIVVLQKETQSDMNGAICP